MNTQHMRSHIDCIQKQRNVQRKNYILLLILILHIFLILNLPIKNLFKTEKTFDKRVAKVEANYIHGGD